MRRVVRVVVVAVVAVALAVGAGVRQAPAVRNWWDASDLEPGLLQVDRPLRGEVSLGNGVYVRFSTGGLTISRQATEIWRGVDRGSPITAGLGELQWRGGPAGPGASGGSVLRARENIDTSLGNLRITGRVLGAAFVRYTGRVFADSYDGKDSLPVTVTITRRAPDSRVLLDVQVPGADVVAIHQYRRPGYTFRGLGAQRRAALLAGGRYPILTRSVESADLETNPAPVPVLFSSTSSGFAVAATTYGVVDLRNGGRLDTSVWQPRLQLRLYDGPPAQMVSQHASDAGAMSQLPGWAMSGAVVGVRGSSAQVRAVAGTLLRADAAVSAVLVRDGGDRRRYAGWNLLVDRLASKDVRVLTSAVPALAVSARAGGPDNEPALLARARREGWLVKGSRGQPVRVQIPDVDAGTVPGELIDLTNPDAVRWYTDVLAARMSRERISGWLAEGGELLPPQARLFAGTAAAEHNAWPRRWAKLTRAACARAGRPDCLLLQDTADERTPSSVGAFGLGAETSDWSASGLGGVLPATLNAGLSGLTITSSGVGGSIRGRGFLGLFGGSERTDELLARWAELQTFGALLRTDEGNGAGPQVWDSPDRLAAFVRMTRIYAVLADYRRTAARQAASGIPVVRPVWLSHPELSQAATDEEYFFGDSLLVVPVLAKGKDSVEASLPSGRWVELFTGRVYQVGEPRPRPTSSGATATDTGIPQQVRLAAPIGQPVVLYRADDAQGRRVRQALVSAGLVAAGSGPGAGVTR